MITFALQEMMTGNLMTHASPRAPITKIMRLLVSQLLELRMLLDFSS